MGKYEPLGAYLRSAAGSEIVLTFAQIERIISARLPDIAMRSQWWLSTTGRGATPIQTEGWRSVGFDAKLHAGRKVKFTRVH